MGGIRVRQHSDGNRRSGRSDWPAGRPRRRGGEQTRGGGQTRGGHARRRSGGGGRDSRRAASPVISATTKLSLRRYVAAGTGAYVVGAENGTFPPIGWHTTGQMGGVWAPPTKLLDGLWFSVGGHWLDAAAKYTTGPGFVRLSFPVTGGLQPTLTEFAPGRAADRALRAHPDPGQRQGHDRQRGRRRAQPGRRGLSVGVHQAHLRLLQPPEHGFGQRRRHPVPPGIAALVRRGRGASPRRPPSPPAPGFWGPTPASQQAVVRHQGPGRPADLEPVRPRGRADPVARRGRVAHRRRASGQRAQGRAGQPARAAGRARSPSATPRPR